MRLSDLEKYNPITIQCHDNPDADALASGYGLYCYFKSKGRNVSLIYSGKNEIHKSNLLLMLDKIDIPVEYVPVDKDNQIKRDGLLITVDCQYGAGNVTKIESDKVAIIDHHQIEVDNVELSLIVPDLSSCSTLVWSLLLQEGYNVTDDEGLGTALYYGLFTDSNQFTEISNPLDKDLKEEIPVDNSLITIFKNSNLSLKELEIAGIAMLRYSFNEEYEFAIIRSQPCDPNILGLISDFLLQVDQIKTCVVFNETNDGFKVSEEDFKLRGHGDLFGTKQSGDMTFKIASIKNDYKILLQAKKDSKEYLENKDTDNDELKNILIQSITKVN